MAGLFGNAPERRNPLMLPRVNERRYDDVAQSATSIMGRPAYNTSDVIAQILAGGLAGLSDRGRANAETERSEAMMEAFGTLLGGGGGLGGSGTPAGTFDMGSLLSQTSARSPDVSPSAAPVGPVGRRPIDGMDMPMGQPETDYFAGVAQSESGGQMIPNANGSGAFGTYQFMPATWQGLVEQYPDQLTPDGISDPQQQEAAMRLYTDQSRGILSQALGREPTNAELYAAHALGPGGATQFLQTLEANPNMPMEQFVQQIAGDNAGVWMEQNPQFAGNSVSDMMAMYSAPFGGSSTPVQTAQAPAPQNAGMALSAAPAQPQGMSPQQQQVIGFLLANGYEDDALTLIAEQAFATQGREPIVVNDQLVDPVTYQVLGDFRDPNQGNDQYRVLSPEQEAELFGSDMPGSFAIGADGLPQRIAGTEGEAPPSMSTSDIASLRDDYTRATDQFAEVSRSYAGISNFLSRGSAAGDMAAVFSFMRILDPASTVREGEFASAQNAAGVPERIRNLYNNIISGQLLSPEQRQDFYDTVSGQYQTDLQVYERAQSEFARLAEQQGADPSLVIYDRMIDIPEFGGAGTEVGAADSAVQDMTADQLPDPGTLGAADIARIVDQIESGEIPNPGNEWLRRAFDRATQLQGQ